MTEKVVPYKTSESGKKEQVAEMFDNIAGNYDFLNTFLSLGIHYSWRKKAIRKLTELRPVKMLDIATGTADFAIAALRLNPEQVTGVDISEGMLQLGREKIAKKGLQSRIQLQLADSEHLPFADATFDAITVGFGVRNFEHLEKGLQEMARVLRPGGMAVVLEFSKPDHWLIKRLYAFYFNYITPLIGRIFSKDKAAYTYLPASVEAFPSGLAFSSIMERCGFIQAKVHPLQGGIASIYTGIKKQ